MHVLLQCFSAGGGLAPEGTCDNVWRHFWLSQPVCRGVEIATGIKWAKARDAAKLPTVHRTAPQQRMIQPQTSVMAGLEKPWCICVYLEGTGRFCVRLLFGCLGT